MSVKIKWERAKAEAAHPPRSPLNSYYDTTALVCGIMIASISNDTSKTITKIRHYIYFITHITQYANSYGYNRS